MERAFETVAVREVVEIVRRARALVFDFDGTLVDSNLIKWRGFELCFVGFPDRLEEIMTYCRGQHHTSRGEKFRHVYEKILELPYTSAVAAVLHERFAAATTDQIVEAPEILGATQFLCQAGGSHEMALLSSTPHDILLQVLVERGWRDYFRVIQGAPVDKAAWLQVFRQQRGFREKDIIFFGDTSEDACAARAAGCTFIAVLNHTPPKDAILSIPDFTSLLML